MEKETIEEAAKFCADIPLHKDIDSEEKYFNSSVRDYQAFIGGVKWQADRSCSEGDMIAFLDWSKSTNQEKSEYELKCLLAGVAIDSKALFNMWAKQFKKK